MSIHTGLSPACECLPSPRRHGSWTRSTLVQDAAENSVAPRVWTPHVLPHASVSPLALALSWKGQWCSSSQSMDTLSLTPKLNSLKPQEIFTFFVFWRKVYIFCSAYLLEILHSKKTTTTELVFFSELFFFVCTLFQPHFPSSPVPFTLWFYRS